MKEPLKILVLEDIQDDVGLIERELRKGGMNFEMMRVDSRAEFLEALRNYKADVILSDHSLPQFNSFLSLRPLDPPVLLYSYPSLSITVRCDCRPPS